MSSCSKHTTSAAHTPPKDPLYSINKPLLHFNTFLDRCILEPIAIFYLRYIPTGFQECLQNFLHNLSEPAIAFNQACQGNWRHSIASLTRLLHNSFWGVGGLFDVAAKHNLPKRTTSFGDTLKQWEAPSGPYIVLPLLGPHYLREACGAFFDWVLNPGALLSYRPLWVVGANATTERANYAPTMRQIYSTTRNFDDLYIEFKNIVDQKAGVHLSEDIENDIF